MGNGVETDAKEPFSLCWKKEPYSRSEASWKVLIQKIRRLFIGLIPNGTNINEAKLYLRKFYFRVVWKTFGRHQVMQHDSYLCKFYKGSVGFPTRRLMQPNNFVGAVENENITIKRKCPVECRRKFDWQYCWIELHNKSNTSWQNKFTTRCLHLAWW